jgi:hypothetical protein
MVVSNSTPATALFVLASTIALAVFVDDFVRINAVLYPDGGMLMPQWVYALFVLVQIAVFATIVITLVFVIVEDRYL